MLAVLAAVITLPSQWTVLPSRQPHSFYDEDSPSPSVAAWQNAPELVFRMMEASVPAIFAAKI